MDEFPVMVERKKLTKINLKLKDVVYGYKRRLNYCILVAKHYIYTSEREGNDFCSHSYVAILRNRLLFEKTILQTPEKL